MTDSNTSYDLGPEKVVLMDDKETGLHGFIVIDSTVLGPALGGTRMYQYKTLQEAECTARNLARAMKYKNALAGLKLGGGKGVIIGNPETDKTEEKFRSYGRYVNALNGLYITGEDSGTKAMDMEIIAKETRFVAGTILKSGNPAPMTAIGGFWGIQACLEVAYNSRGIRGKSFAIKGLGEVGFPLARLLYANGGKLVVADVNERRLDRIKQELPKAEIVDTSLIHAQNVNVYCPCAMGEDITVPMVKELNCGVVAGLANNVLVSDEVGDLLDEFGIFYAPDFALNSGGVRNLAVELREDGYNLAVAYESTLKIYGLIKSILEQSLETAVPSYLVARTMAEDIIEKARQQKKIA